MRSIPPERRRGGPPRTRARRRSRGSPTAKEGIPVTEVVSPDALALVRFGLRQPDDPRIVDTVKVDRRPPEGRDARAAPAWHRYNGDGYGEKADGSPYDREARRDRPRLAAADRRAGPLRAGGGPPRRGDPPAARHGGVRRRRRDDPRAGLGHRRHPRARPLPRPALGLGHAPGLGPRRIPQAPPLAPRRPHLRHARRRRCSATWSRRSRPPS